MFNFTPAHKMDNVHSDIRGPIFVEANRMEAQGQKILKLNTGNPANFGFGMPQSGRKALLDNVDKAVGYCDMKGMPAARQAIYNYHLSKQVPTTMEDIFIGNGVSEVAWMAMTALLDPGDEILIPMPSYSLWTNLAVMNSAKPVLYRCDEQSCWYPDIQDIRSKITPNNPPGAVYNREILEQMIQVAREHNLIILSDEIYDRLVMDDLHHDSVAALAPDHPVITCNGLSKSHIICGFRCGWMVLSGPEHFRSSTTAAIQKIAAMRLCGNALTQLVIPAALEDMETPNAMIRPGGRLYEQRKATLEVLDSIDGISYVKNVAAFYLFPKLDVKKFNITNDKQFAKDLLHATNILIVPGSGFDWAEPDHFRIVMLPEAPVLRDAMVRMGNFLDGYRQK